MSLIEKGKREVKLRELVDITASRSVAVGGFGAGWPVVGGCLCCTRQGGEDVTWPTDIEAALDDLGQDSHYPESSQSLRCARRSQANDVFA